MTNADVIRRMTDDELYEFLSEWECGDIDYAVTFCDLCKGGGNELNIDCDGCRKHWLTRNAVEYGGLFYWKRNKDFTDRKTEPNSSEKPKNCEEPKTEPQVIACPIQEEDAEYARWLYEDEPPMEDSPMEDSPMDEYYKDHDEFYEPQTDCAWKGGRA